jgi:hypothetical protein
MLHDHQSANRVVPKFYGVFRHLVVRIHRRSPILVGSMWYHLVGTIHTCSVLIRWPCDMATVRNHRSRCVYLCVIVMACWSSVCHVKYLSSDGSCYRRSSFCQSLPSTRGNSGIPRYVIYVTWCLIAYDIIQMLFLDESGNRSECIRTFM